MERSAPQVLAVATVRGLGGAEVVLLRILERLARRGWTVTLAVPGPGEVSAEARSRGIPLSPLRVPAGRMARGSPAAALGSAALAALATARRPDVVLLNGRIGQRLVPGAALARVPAVVFVHDLLGLGDRSRLARSGPFRSTISSWLVPSEAVGRTLVALGEDPERIRNARVAVELDPEPPAEAPGWASGEGEVIGYVGRIEPRKGTLDLVRAAPRILERRPGARVVIVGDDDFAADAAYAAAVRREASRPELGGAVVLAGAVPRAHELMGLFDVLAVPSREEPGGTAAAEALAAGVPVVAADTGGMPEVVIEGRTGALFPPGDSHALAEAVLGVLESPERAAMAANAREHAQLFSAERSADVAEEALLEAIRGRPPR